MSLKNKEFQIMSALHEKHSLQLPHLNTQTKKAKTPSHHSPRKRARGNKLDNSQNDNVLLFNREYKSSIVNHTFFDEARDSFGSDPYIGL